MLINFRNALMSGKRLPYDAELEYLESTGTQWIDTGVKVYDDTNVEITVKVNTQSEVAFIGSATSTDRFVIRSYSDSLSYGFGSWWANTSATLYNQWRTLRTDVSVPTVYCDGTSYPTTNTPSAKSRTDSILIFDSFRANRGDVAVAGVKIWRGSTLVRDLIPVRKGTVGYLYDRVSGKLFGNAGTGDFVLGPDVVPVEYIESHGTEYIDTGVKMRNGLSFDAEFIPTGNSPNQVYDAIYGVYNSSNIGIASLSCIVPADNSGSRYGNRFMDKNPMVPNAVTTYKNKRIVYHQANDSFTVSVDGTINDYGALNSTQTAESDATIMLFGIKSASFGNRYAKAKGFFFMISDAGNVANKYLPVRVGTGSTWEGAMMDVLTRRIYRNAGTGAFAYGNDLKYPIPAE